MSTEARPPFTFYPTYWDAIRRLPDKALAAVVRGMCEFAFNGKPIEEPAESAKTPEIMAFSVLSAVIPNIESSIRSYAAGKKGGAAKKEVKEPPFVENSVDGGTPLTQSDAETRNPPSGISSETAEPPLTKNGKKRGTPLPQNDSKNAAIHGSEKEKEKEKEKDVYVGAEPKQVRSTPPVISIPLLGNATRDVYQDDVDHWSELYPAVDVMQELRKMVGWCEGHPKKLKTPRGADGFITSWLAREQDKGGSRSNTSAQPEPEKKAPLPEWARRIEEGIDGRRQH